ncbi:deoxycytidylate deaminase [Cladophialophora carrionii]|uniref:Deoxycytidylate deaminase n=1 Tax=Cladophialophora carrionii TaxID=86049 RepID=A0A1C1CCU7_9EURO|nr:deoxycytidylate deaminase [Cladophialophora carrionii]
MPLADFIHYNDLQLYGTRDSRRHTDADGDADTDRDTDRATDPSRRRPRSALAPLLAHAHLSILNTHTTQPAYHAFLATLDLSSPTRLRPTWDAYFMTLASLASRRSNCMKRRVGCVLVHHARIISTGYNGTPRGLVNCNEGGCPRCNNGGSGGGGVALATCLCLHAEENALLEAGRERIRDGAVLYCDTCPCLTCSVKIAQVGVKEVVYSQSYNMDDASRRVLGEAGVTLRQFVPTRSGFVGFDVPESAADWHVDDGKEGQLVVLNGKK